MKFLLHFTNTNFKRLINVKYIIRMRRYFPKVYGSFKDVSMKVDLSNYVRKFNVEKATGVGTSLFASEVDLANLKSDVDKLDINVRYKLDSS